jgi:pimeloyl-ACP methyl ester carboxylesterase
MKRSTSTGFKSLAPAVIVQQSLVEDAVPGGVEQAVADADTFFGIELPSFGEWTFSPDQAAATRQPVLSVLGSDSGPLFVEGRELIHSWFPQAEDLDVDGAGHLLQAQQPKQVAQGLAEFVKSHRLSSVAWTSFESDLWRQHLSLRAIGRLWADR